MPKYGHVTLMVAALVAAACSRSGPAETPDGSPSGAVVEQRVEPASAAGATLPRDAAIDALPEAVEGKGAQVDAAGEPPLERRPDVVYVPTPQPVVERMLELAEVKPGDVVYDLGCGDGRIVVTAATRYGVRAFGFDIDPVRVAEAQSNVEENGVGELVTIEQKDIFTLDLGPATVVTLYLLPELNVKLLPQLERLRPGARIVSHDFDMVGVTPVAREALTPEGADRPHEIYLWRTPLQRTSTPRALRKR